jgi:hypothetical protein
MVLPKPDVVGQEEVHARQFQGLAERHHLVVEQLDPCAEGRLEQARIRGRHAAPLERVQIGGEVARRIEAVGLAQPMRLGLDHPGAQLALPQDLQAAPGSVVIEANQADQRLPRPVFAEIGARNLSHQILPVPDLHNLPSRGKPSARCERCQVGPASRAPVATPGAAEPDH